MLTKAQIIWNLIGTILLFVFVFWGLWKGKFFKTTEGVWVRNFIYVFSAILLIVIVVAMFNILL